MVHNRQDGFLIQSIGVHAFGRRRNSTRESFRPRLTMQHSVPSAQPDLNEMEAKALDIRGPRPCRSRRLRTSLLIAIQNRHSESLSSVRKRPKCVTSFAIIGVRSVHRDHAINTAFQIGAREKHEPGLADMFTSEALA
jgi:hypothetical protein